MDNRFIILFVIFTNEIYFFLVFTTILFIKLPAQQTAALTSPFGAAPLESGFLKNIGQVADFNNKPVDFVYYQANVGGQQVFITSYGLSLLLANPINTRRITARAGKGMPASQKHLPTDSTTIVTYQMERIDIVLENASILTGNIVTVANKQSPKFNFYINDPNAREQQFLNEILIKNVYPGIDWKVYIMQEKGKAAHLKYDFIVHPGADASNIQLRYSDNAKLKAVGSEVEARGKMGFVKEQQPYSYLKENLSEVPVSYSLKRNTIHFYTGKYNKSQTLVIDPSIFWMTYLTSKVQAMAYRAIVGNDVETDAAGNIFVQLSGEANCPFPTVNPGGGAYYQEITSSPNGAMIISKFAPGGQLKWCTYFGNGVVGSYMTIDKTGNIFALGRLLDGTPSIPDQHSSIPLLNNGGFYDGSQKRYFITRFSNAGALLWSSYFVNFSSYPTDMTYDVNGNIYVVGWSDYWDFPIVDPGGGAYMTNSSEIGAHQVLFISQFDANNKLTWSTRLGGNNYDPMARVCCDKAGNIYLGGHARSDKYPLVDAGGYFDTTAWGAVITRFNPARQMTWSTYFPYPFALADLTTDDSCNLYVAASGSITKFDSSTKRVFVKTVNTPRAYFWSKINYDRFNDQLQLLGVMNDFYFGFPTINTACNGSFFNDGISPHTYSNATGPIFATMTTSGDFSYLSLVDWVYEYYDINEMAIDPKGDPIYLFGYNQDGYVAPNPQLTNPGNGAYFDSTCCYLSNSNSSALLLKLNSSDLSVTTQVTPPNGCNCDGVATATPQCGQAPFKYLWSNGSTTEKATGLCPGNYTVKVTDANNLSRTVNITIAQPPGSISSAVPAIVPENCNLKNGTINIEAVNGGTAPLSYSIDGISFQSSTKFTGLDSGTYILRIKDAGGCEYRDTIAVSKIPGPIALTHTAKNSSCVADNGQIQVTNVTGGVGPYQYTLTNSETNKTGIFTGLAAADYQIKVLDSAGCSLLKTVTVERAGAATDAEYSIKNDHCNQGLGVIEVTSVMGGVAPYTFSVDSVSFVTGSINHLAKGTYDFYIRDMNGCVLKKSPLIVTNEPGPSAINLTVDHAYCGKLTGNITINSAQGGSDPYLYSIDSTGYYSSQNFTAVKPGNHTIYVKDAYACVYSESVEIKYKVAPSVRLLPVDTTVCYDQKVIINLTGDMNQIKNTSWNIPAQGIAAMLTANKETKILVTITDTNNCVTTAASLVKVKACNTPENCIAIPAAFTPNNDGKNDKVMPLVNGCNIESLSFRMYNRYGKLVFETQKQGEGWDGSYKGIAQPGGAFIYACDYISGGVKTQKKGTIILIR